MKYYLDTCIWLNFFKKEGDINKGAPYWKIALKFIYKFETNIYFSGIVIKEIKFILTDFEKRKKFIIENFKFIKLTSKDYNLARRYEIKHNSEISFYDFLHIAICKNNSFILITRDKDMINIAKKYIRVNKPEEILI